MSERLRLEAAGRSVCVAGGRFVPDDGRACATVRIPGGELRPGLINPHDHLHRNHYGRLGDGPYANAYDWGEDIHRRHADRVAAGRAVERREALLRGAWKNLRAGVTTVVHHDPWEDEFSAGFPLRVAPVRVAHSLGFERDFAHAAAPDPRHPGRPLCIHLAEGTDAQAAEEVRTLAGLGLLDARLIAVHCVGADADGVRRLRASGAALVWCPTSNAFLLGATAPAALLAEGMDVLVGSDSLLTAAGDLLDELRAARALGRVSDERLLAGVGELAARRLGIPAPSLEPGAPADLAVFRRPLLEASAADVALVMVGGVVRVADVETSEALRGVGIAVRPPR